MRRVVLVLAVVAVAYAVGWISDARINDDPCAPAFASETDRYEPIQRWFPVRTDCRVTTPSASWVEPGSSEVFVAMFVFTLVAGFALFSSVAPAIRVTAVLAVGAVAFAEIFLF